MIKFNGKSETQVNEWKFESGRKSKREEQEVKGNIKGQCRDDILIMIER